MNPIGKMTNPIGIEPQQICNVINSIGDATEPIFFIVENIGKGATTIESEASPMRAVTNRIGSTQLPVGCTMKSVCNTTGNIRFEALRIGNAP